MDKNPNEQIEAILENILLSDDGYERDITIVFPDECKAKFGLGYLRLPIRKILDLYGQHNPDKRTMLKDVKEEFYGGDSIDDYIFSIGDTEFESMNTQEAAELRAKWNRGQEQRLSNSQEVQDSLKLRESRGPLNIPEGAEKDLRDLRERSAELQSRWDKVVSTPTDERSVGECENLREIELELRDLHISIIRRIADNNRNRLEI